MLREKVDGFPRCLFLFIYVELEMMKIVQAVECGIIEEISYETKTKRKKNIMHAA